jgi:hypothetical protein
MRSTPASSATHAEGPELYCRKEKPQLLRRVAWRRTMTYREKLEVVLFGGVIAIGLPAILFVTRMISG